MADMNPLQTAVQSPETIWKLEMICRKLRNFLKLEEKMAGILLEEEENNSLLAVFPGIEIAEFESGSGLYAMEAGQVEKVFVELNDFLNHTAENSRQKEESRC